MSEVEGQPLAYKVICLGGNGVGKSSILVRLVQGYFCQLPITIGIDYLTLNVSCEGEEFGLQIWDTAGQQRYRTITCNYLNQSRAACIVFDLTNERTLQEAQIWLELLVLHCGNHIPKLLLANKSDLFSGGELPSRLATLQGRIDSLVEKYGCRFLVVSARSGENINEALTVLTREVYQQTHLKQKLAVKSSFKLMTFEIEVERKTKRRQKNCC